MPYAKSRSGSVGSITDFLKRKRENTEREDHEIRHLRQDKVVNIDKLTNRFEHLNKTSENAERKRNLEMEKKMDDMSKMLAGILERMEDLKEIKSELKEVKKENEELKNELVQIRKDYKEREEEFKKERREWKVKMLEIEERLEKKERYERKNNIIVKGLDLKEGEQKMQEWIKNELDVEVNTVCAKKIGNKEDRTIYLVKVNTWEEKREIMKNKYKLKNRSIFIENDMTWKEREVQNKLRQRAEKERKNGKRAKVIYKKIIIDDTWFEWDENTQDIKRLTKEPNTREEKKKRAEAPFFL